MTTNKTSGSQLCPGCQKLINRSLAHCPYCQMKNPSARWKSTLLFGSGRSADKLVTTLITANVVMFILSIAIDPRLTGFNPFQFLAPSNQSLLVLGSTGTQPLFQLHRWWSLVAAGFLHGGLLHLVFNMLALRQLAPLMVLEFGTNRTIILYTLGGAGGFLLSSLAGVQYTIGASASICSLIGAILYYSRSRGGIYGRNIFSQVGGWALGIAVFGFFIPGINNWGHGGGMVVGVLLAYLLGYREKKPETFNHRVLAMGCVITTGLILSWSCLNGILFVLLRD